MNNILIHVSDRLKYIHDIAYIREYRYEYCYDDYVDIINGTRHHSTRSPFTLDFSHPGFLQSPGFITILSQYLGRFRQTSFYESYWDFKGEFRFSSWTALPIRIFRFDMISSLDFRSVHLFQRGSFRRYIVSELYLGIVFHNFCHFVK